MLISVVVPVYNEEETLRDFVHQLVNALSRLNVPYEILLCENGSTDRTPPTRRRTAPDSSATSTTAASPSP